MVDIRDDNRNIKQQLIPWQPIMTFAVTDCGYTSVFDAAGFFLQWLVQIADWPKITIMSHREPEQIKVAVMRFKNSSTCVHRKIDTTLHTYSYSHPGNRDNWSGTYTARKAPSRSAWFVAPINVWHIAQRPSSVLEAALQNGVNCEHRHDEKLFRHNHSRKGDTQGS